MVKSVWPLLASLVVGGSSEIASVNASQGTEAVAARSYFYIGGGYVNVYLSTPLSTAKSTTELRDVIIHTGWRRHAPLQGSDVRREPRATGRSKAERAGRLRAWASSDRHGKLKLGELPNLRQNHRRHFSTVK